MITYMYSCQDLTGTVNTALNLFIHKLANDGAITQEQADTIAKQYASVVAPPSVWGSTIKKLLGTDNKNEPVITIVKVI